MKLGYKIALLSITILLVGSILLGTSYSLWVTSVSQTGTNQVNVGCFRVTFTDTGFGDAQNINLTSENNYPISDTTGKTLTPYKFTIVNECSVASKYKINLETLSAAATGMNTDFLKVYFYDSSSVPAASYNVPNYVSDTTPSLVGATSAMNLVANGYLAPSGTTGSTKTYLLRVWIDNNATTTSTNVMGKRWQGKISVISEATNTAS